MDPRGEVVDMSAEEFKDYVQKQGSLITSTYALNGPVVRKIRWAARLAGLEERYPGTLEDRVLVTEVWISERFDGPLDAYTQTVSSLVEGFKLGNIKPVEKWWI